MHDTASRRLPRLASPAVGAALALCASLGSPLFLMGGCGAVEHYTRPGGIWGPAAGSSSSGSAAVSQTITPEQLLTAGRRLKTQGDVDRALRAFERAIEINPEFTQAYLSAGDIYREQGDYASAERQYSQAATIEPRNFDAQYLHGLSLQLLTRFGEAIRAYLRALAIRPEDFNTNLNLATAYLQVGEAQQGLTYAQRAVRLNPESGEARVNLGSIYGGLGQHENAVTEYQQASELMPLNGELLLNLANSLYNLGRYAEAANTLEEAVMVGPSAIAYERLGASRYKLGQAAEAEAAFRESLEIDARHYPAMNGVAVCLLSRYVLSRESDEAARVEAMNMLRGSLQIEGRQDKVIELLRQFNN